MRCKAARAHLLLSSDDDSIKRFSIRRQSESSPDFMVRSRSRPNIMKKKKIVLSSSEGEYSPEIVPKKRHPKANPINANSKSLIAHIKSKKRMILESDTENSFIIQHDKNKKMTCLEDTPTPLKVKNSKKRIIYSDDDVSNASESDDDTNGSNNSCNKEGSSDIDSKGDEDKVSDDDGPDEDQIVMSRATRMSIMGVIPKDNDSDESDFIHSDDDKSNSHAGSTCSLNDLPGASTVINETVAKPDEPNHGTTRLSWSPFSSPLNEITNKLHSHYFRIGKHTKTINPNVPVVDISRKENESTSPEIIVRSSDDEDEVKANKKSPRAKKSPKRSRKVKDKEASRRPVKDSTIRQYLAPPSSPNQVVYVKKQVRETELRKLNGLQRDLLDIRNLMDNMDLNTLPDGGVRLIERLTALEAEVRRQGDRVGNMLVEPDEDIAKDTFDKGISWDAIQTASNSVQPRMFGKHAMATHIGERNLILDRLRNLHESLASRPPETELATQPAALKSELMPHQRHALTWMRWRETQRPCGGILADDMGLGKTITMIALMMADKEHNIDDDDDDDDDDEPVKRSAKVVRGGTLVVCPASLMHQWVGEVKKHCRPHSALVRLHHGAARTQHAHRLAANDIVVTTYNILQRDNEKNGVLVRVRWRRVILDEAHIVRNHKSATFRGVAALKARVRWCLTGTPVHNKDLDLFALVKFLRVTPFTELPMWKKWIDNKSQGGQERLSTVMRCILLRRTKAQLQQRGQLACLPPRTAHQRSITLTSQEMNVYQKVLVLSKTLFAQFLHQRAEKNADAQGLLSPEKDTSYAKMHKKMIALQGAKPVKSHAILVLLLRLRQVCCHCGLIAMLDPANDSAGDLTEDPAGQDLLAELNKLTLEESNSRRMSDNTQEEEQDGPEEGMSVAEAIRSVLSHNNPVLKLSRPSSKISAVMDCLRNDVFVNKGHKAVVVSQWTSVLRLVEHQLRVMRARSVTLSGNVPVTQRTEMVDALNDPKSDVRVMLLSLCAGGVGLNLCGANHLLLLDPHWNPQLEQQAQDRIYRVGQRLPVQIYRFMCVDTVEQTIRRLQDAKLELADNVLTGARHTNDSKLSIRDLKLLFNMGD